MRNVDKNRAYAYLSIDKFTCSAEELTKRIGLQPTETWNVGEVVRPVRFPRKYSAWHLKTRLPLFEDIERHVMDVLEQIRGREAVIRSIARDNTVRLQCVGYYSEFNPGFRLEADIVRRIAKCGMLIDLDDYHYF